MYKKIISAITVLTIGILLFLTSQVSAAPAQTKRLWGNDRYQTCSEIVNEGWKTADYAVIVNGENFPDALSASTLAKKYNAPILLTQKESLDSNTQEQLKRLDVKKVFIVGGPGVISSVVESNLDKLGISVERFYGATRNETSIAVANQIGTDNGIILTTDNDYTDALSVAPIAAKLQMPIILVPKDTTPSSVANFIADKNIPVTYVLGGTNLISDSVASKFPSVQRVEGNDKYERNINIIKTFGDKFDFSKACLAYSEGFADALSGSAFAAINGNPIILVGRVPSAAIKNFLLSQKIDELNILGGTAGITDSNVNSLFDSSIPATSVGQLKVHYIDVGQGDSILIQTPNGKNMLIDAGTNESTSKLTSYLQNLGITQLDIIAGTHPHEDHIGGMDAVINMFKIGKIYMPKVTTTTKTYKDVITAIKNKGLSINNPTLGTTVDLDSAIKLEILAPNSDNYEDLNNYSIVFKLTYGNKSFLFDGDAEDVSEKEMLSKGYDLKADVLKIGHHGSNSSTTPEFLAAVAPKYAVISVGKGNDYGHPTQDTLQKLKNAGISVFRTDEQGTIVAISDGNNINFNTEPSKVILPLPIVNILASVDNPTPSQNSTIKLTVSGGIGGNVKAVCHYKSTDTTYTGVIGNDGSVVIPVKIGRASIGYTVVIDIFLTIDGQTYTTKTSFTPQ